jgi:hypothetical protein
MRARQAAHGFALFGFQVGPVLVGGTVQVQVQLRQWRQHAQHLEIKRSQVGQCEQVDSSRQGRPFGCLLERFDQPGYAGHAMRLPAAVDQFTPQPRLPVVVVSL